AHSFPAVRPTPTKTRGETGRTTAPDGSPGPEKSRWASERMASDASGAVGGGDAFVYMGEGGPEVPMNAVRVRVDPSVVAIPADAFQNRRKLEEVELQEGLREIGEFALCNCKALRGIRIPPSVQKISRCAFESCQKLERVELSEGLRVIGMSAFASCFWLRHITVPSTVQRIDNSAFYRISSSLSSIHLPDGLEQLEAYAFSCSKFSHFRIPPLITSIASDLFFKCDRMFSVELPEHTRDIGTRAFYGCSSLRNVAIPPNAIMNNESFARCDSLTKLFGSETQIIRALKCRFDGLPIHRMLYYQSYQPDASTLDQFKRETNLRSGQQKSLRIILDPTGKQQDCLGMTPLHILACSTNQNIELYRWVISRYPENLVTRDRWGALPILYVLWRNCYRKDMQRKPLWKIITLLFESYHSKYPNYEFDWSETVKTLASENATGTVIRNFFIAEVEFFQEQSIDWDSVVAQLPDDRKRAKVFWFVYTRIIEKRIHDIRVERLQKNFIFEFNGIISNRGIDRSDALVEIQSKLEYYEAEFCRLKEATAMLELALWKAKINESVLRRRSCKKKLRVDASGFRNECRIRCGANHVIKNVLPFLLPNIQHN
ncbi:hypothetical protein ACHAWF_008880, partial [Thalassiosira exigua]